jgi:hypothetical protein
MARGRKKAGDEPQPPTTGNGNEAAGTPANKLEAVRRALDELGEDATPKDIQRHVQERYGMAMTPEHVSTYKSSLLRKRKGRRGRKPKGEGAPAPAPSAARGEAAISLRDLRALKELADRLGGAKLRELAELVS